MNDEEKFFVEITDAQEIRRNLLLSSKQIIHSLKKHKEYEEVKNKKRQKIEELKKLMNKIKSSAASLHQILPKTKELKTKIAKANPEITKKQDLFFQRLSKIEEKLKALE